jgi:hypothetical protein
MQSNVLVFIFDHLRRGAYLQFRPPMQNVYGIVERNLLEMDDVPKVQLTITEQPATVARAT